MTFNFDPKTKNTNIIISTSQSGTTFSDVGGLEDAKNSLAEIVDFLNNPQVYSKIGATLPKGILLIGPPGTGKTLLARALAGEAKVPFISASGSDFIEMYAGVGAARIRKLFELAEKHAPCIVFIDEIDTIGKRRNNFSAAASDERDQTLNQLLSEMDGFSPTKGIVVLAATNRPETLDTAISRKGRFDRRIIIDKPDVDCRLAILQAHAKNVELDNNIDLEQIAYSTTGSSGADLKSIINEAAIRAVRAKRTKITQEDIQESMEQVLSGFRQNNIVLSELEKCIIAIHESAHAIANIAFNSNEKIQKISIIPRNASSLGYTVNYKQSEQYLVFKSTLVTKIRILLAGYCAEQTMIGEVSSSAVDDIEKATCIAKDMISTMGMSSELGPIVLNKELISEDGHRYPVSSITSFLIDRKTHEIITRYYNETLEFIKLNLPIIQKVAEELVASETLSETEILNLIKGESVTIPDYPEIDEEPVFSSFTLKHPGTISNISEKPAIEPSKAVSSKEKNDNSPKPNDNKHDKKDVSCSAKNNIQSCDKKQPTNDSNESCTVSKTTTDAKKAEHQSPNKSDIPPKKNIQDKPSVAQPVQTPIEEPITEPDAPDNAPPDMDIPDIASPIDNPDIGALIEPDNDAPTDDEIPDVDKKIEISSKKTSAKAKKNAKEEAAEVLNSFLNNDKRKSAQSKKNSSKKPTSEPTENDY